MDRGYPLSGEEFFRKMMHPEEGRGQYPVVANDIGGGSPPSNVVSFQDYRQRQVERLHRNPHKLDR
jgi:hypothetical protein